MAVPAHDERDFEFASKFNLPIIKVISSDKNEKCYTGNGKMVNSGEFNGISNHEFKNKVLTLLEKNKSGKKTINYKLRDWIFTRQRYWGEPIPILHSKNGRIGLKEKDLPLTLPNVINYLPTNDGLSPLARNNKWSNVTIDGIKYKRESNTMPQWAGSCWYYLRYLDPLNNKEFADKKKIKYWMPVDLYIGGAEHAVLHLLYSRFWHKVLYDLKYVSTKEPFKKLVNQGMILGRSNFIYRIKDSKKYVSHNLKNKYKYTKLHVDVNLVNNDQLNIDKFKKSSSELKNSEFILENNKYICGHETEKMSKSKSNVVNPDEIISKYGSDTLRMYEMFLGPIEQSKPWNTNGIDGVFKFLNKFWNLFINKNNQLYISDEEPNKNEYKILHRAIKKIQDDIERLSLNTCISLLMITVNELGKINCNKIKILKPLLILISPFAPHIAEELWNKIGNKKSISYANYPTFKNKYLIENEYEYPIMINGKLRTKISFSLKASNHEIEKVVINNKSVQKWIKSSEVKKVIIVTNKIINVVA